MNARCYRCGWSFTLTRETIAAAVANADARGDTFHVEPCPHCKQAIKLPLDQLRHALPPGWKPEPPPPAPAPEAKAAEPPAPEAAASEPPPPAHKEKPRHRHAGKKAA